MNKKNLLKLSLDLCMVITLALMYNKSSINMTFHEVGGLALIGIFLIHVLINGKWVTVVTKKLFSKTLPIKTRIGYIVNILLLISFLLIGISGIFISKVLFQISSSGGFSWKMIHYTSAAVALILVGIHLGLHKHFITSHLSKLIPLPKIAGKVIGIALTLIIFAFGCYSVATTSFISWISMPFSSQQMTGGFEGGRPSGMEGGFDKDSQNRPDMPSGEDSDASGDMAFPSGTPSAPADDTSADTTADDTSSDTTSDEITTDDTSDDTTVNSDTAGDLTDSNDMPSRPSGDIPSGDFPGGDQKMGKEGGSFSILSILKTIAQYFSIVYLFATITALLELLILKLTKKTNRSESTENPEGSVNSGIERTVNSGNESTESSAHTDTSENS